MKNVFKREFSSCFHRLYGYIIIGLLLLASAIMFYSYNVKYANESISAICFGMSIVVAFLTPIIAVNSFCVHKGVDADAMYDMMPITTRDVVLGKYFSALSLAWLPNIAIAFYSVIIGFFGVVDHKASYTALFGLALFEMAILAVCFFIAAKVRTRVKAYAFCYLTIIICCFLDIFSVLVPTTRMASLVGFAVVALLVGVLLYLFIRKALISLSAVAFLAIVIGVSFWFVPESFSGAFESFIKHHSIFSHLYSFIAGIFNIKGIVFLSLLSCVFVFLAWRSYEGKYEKPQTLSCLSLKKITSLGMATLIVCLSLITTYMCALFPNRFMSLDSTASHKYSVSTEAREFLSKLDKDVTLYLLEPTDNEGYELYLERLVASSDKLTLKKVFYADDPMFYISRNINTNSISADSIVVECEGSYNYLSYNNLFVYSNEKFGENNMSYSDYSYYRSLFSSSEEYYEYFYSLIYNTTEYFNADLMICSYIEYTAADIIPTNYYMTGHGELSLSEVSNPYSDLGISELDIIENDIPLDAASILINVPKTDITIEEKQKLLEYLERGGQLTFITEQLNLKHTNLCSVLSEYGLSSGEDIVKDIVESESGEEEEVERSAEFIPTLHTDNDVLYYLDGSNITPYSINATAITPDISAKEGLTIIPLLTSSSESILGDSDNTATYTLACAVEAPNGAKIAWFTGGEAFNQASTDSATAVMCTLAWVTLKYESEVGDIPACLYSMPLEPTSTGGATMVVLVIVIFSIALMVIGIVAFYIRRKAKQ